MFLAPFHETAYQLVARLGLQPPRTEPTLEAQLNAVVAERTGTSPADNSGRLLHTHHGPDPPQSVCIHCGAHCYAWLTECVACGRPLPPRVELTELRPHVPLSDGPLMKCPDCGAKTYAELSRCMTCNALLHPPTQQQEGLR